MSGIQPTVHLSPAKGIHGARINVGRLTADLARETAKHVGFAWFTTPNAPSSSQQLIGAFEHSVRTGEPYPVSSLFCDSTIYLEPSLNHQYRFLHDVHHRLHGLSFTLEDEWALGTHHMAQATAAGLGPGSIEHELLRCDIFGQLILLGVGGRFPYDQGLFALECAEIGLDAGVLRELQRVAA